MATHKDAYAKMVCHFLAEALRTKKTNLPRAAEIGEKFLVHINLLDTEKDFLSLVKELSKDFEELVVLENKIHKSIAQQQSRTLEDLIREFTVEVLAQDSKLALSILQDAAAGKVSLKDLEEKYPAFKEFVNKHG
jgi:hypothetical protein